MKHKKTIYEMYVKRILDFMLALIGIIILSPLLIILAILVKVKLGSPIVFKQKRPGLNGKVFTLYKFRSMTDQKDENGNFLPDEIRITPFGKALRESSLDELLELFNILAGHLSIIGPRPLLVQYLPRYNETQMRRHEVRPGLTGYAQVNGRNSISWEEKFEMDVWYVEHINFFLDLKILFKTIEVVLRRDDISSSVSVTMEEFMGTKK